MDRTLLRVHVVDSHTGGEPTRVVFDGGPDLGAGTAAQKLDVFRTRHDRFRSAVVNEPRGSDVLVGALLCDPDDPACVAGVIFFNNVGFLGMCGHGAIGVVTTLAHLRRIQPGSHKLETPVGIVTAVLHPNGSVSITNVPSYRKAKKVTLNIAGLGSIVGDVAWGGNWFFLVENHGLTLELGHIEKLIDAAWRIRETVNCSGFPEVDHVELFGPPGVSTSQSRNFVLCPGKAYDRSPCGTGTSAKIACLALDGKLAENDLWVQESIVGSTFTGCFRWLDRAAGTIVPTITGAAFVNAETTLLFDEMDPFCWGMR